MPHETCNPLLPRHLVPPDLSICRNPAQPASSRSKAVDTKPAHSFQTVRRPGRVSPVSDKPDRC